MALSLSALVSPIKVAQNIRDQVGTQKFAVARRSEWSLSADAAAELEALKEAWNDMPFDRYYGGTEASYRVRRYSDFNYRPLTGALWPRSHVAYFQSEAMNGYAGGYDRHFGDVTASTYENRFLRALVDFDFARWPIDERYLNRAWICQIHMIRIYVGPGETTPITPEGIHSDGYPFSGVHLINRVGVTGARSSVYTREEEELASLTFETTLDSLWFEDRELKHYVTPMSAVGDAPGYRDLLAISFSLPDSPFTTVR